MVVVDFSLSIDWQWFASCSGIVMVFAVFVGWVYACYVVFGRLICGV